MTNTNESRYTDTDCEVLATYKVHKIVVEAIDRGNTLWPIWFKVLDDTSYGYDLRRDIEFRIGSFNGFCVPHRKFSEDEAKAFYLGVLSAIIDNLGGVSIER